MDKLPKSNPMSDAELYKQLLGATPFVRPWMEPFLPTNIYLRDVLVGVIAGAICFIFTIGLAFALKIFVGENAAFLVSLIPMGVILAFTLGRIHSRYLAATVKFRRIKNGEQQYLDQQNRY